MFSSFKNNSQGTLPLLSSEFFNSLPLSCVLLKSEEDKFIIQQVTEAHCNFTGFTRQEVIDKHVPDAFQTNDEDWEHLKASFNKVILTGEPDLMDTMRYDLIEPNSGDLIEIYWQVQNF
ncbi:PAS domain S-box-containing protein [Salegentibacter sp. 24]|uniref:hypothetical protein n=1 Tax=Salegentibacter sp. 24 TaxID=2183986 RepID=UPI00105E9C75|nr:hypothetical protein [Salegentibacter sp. 24]TDN93410.1 PAS domain S-box-containing protein [Salegentibacter sp. 24]